MFWIGTMKKYFLNLSMKYKLLLTVLPLVFVVFGLTIFYVYNQTGKILKEKNYKEARALAFRHSLEVKMVFEHALTNAKSVASVLQSKIKSNSDSKRKDVNDILEKMLLNNESFLGAWTVWEPNALDGNDKNFKNSIGSDAEGRFAPYWNRVGGMHLETCVDYEQENQQGEYYHRSKRTLKDAVIEPVTYKINDKDVMVVSVAAPIIENGIFRGVVGVDFSMDYIQEMITQIKPYNTGYAALVASNGVIAAHPKLKVIGKKYVDADVNPNAAAIQQKIINGEEIEVEKKSISDGSIADWVFMPFTVGNSNTPWSLALGIPLDQLYADINHIAFILVIVGLIGLLVVSFVLYIFASKIAAPLTDLTRYAEKLNQGEFDFNISHKFNDEIGTLGISFENLSKTIKTLIYQTNELTKAAVSGKLDYRADAKAFNGDYGVLLTGFNSTIDAIITPLNLTAEYVDRIAKGDIPPKITEDYHGDFNEIKNNINQCIDALNLVVNEIKTVSKMQGEGDIGAYAEPMRFSGAYREVILGYNDALQMIHGSVAKILTMTVRYGEGDLGERLETLPGKLIVANNALDSVRDNLLNVNNEIGRIIDNAKSGHLDYRGNSSNFKGEFKSIIAGMNEVLDSVIKPLNVAAEYVDRIAKGDIPPKITDDYHGDFNEIKNNLNTCIDSLSSVVNEIRTVSHKQGEGDIEAYAEPAKHNGAYRDVIIGFNEALQMIHGSVATVLAMTVRYGEGDISERLDTLPGKLIVANKALDSVYNNLHSVDIELGNIIENVKNGNLDYRGNSSNFKGTFKELVDGINEVLDTVINPLNLAAEYVDRIAKGDIPPHIDLDYKGDFNAIKNNLNTCIEVMNLINLDLKSLIQSAASGNLDYRSDYNRYFGAWKSIIGGANEMLASIQIPVEELKYVLNLVAVNDFTQKVKNDYSGVWEDLKTDVNNVMDRLILTQSIMIDVSNGDTSRLEKLLEMPTRSANDKLRPAAISMMQSVRHINEDVLLLSKFAVAGDLSVRADAGKHKGDFKKTIDGVNATIDALAQPLFLASEYLSHVANGDSLETVEIDQYKGEYKKIVMNMNKLTGFLYSLIEDTGRVAESSVKGILDARIDLAKYPGAWNIITKGFNDSIDVLSKSFETSLKYFAKVSAGDNFEAVNESEWQGDYRKLAIEINKLRDFINKLIADTKMTAKAAVEGDLSKRIDLSKYSGGWHAVTKGFNDTLNAVIEPIEEAKSVIETMSTGNLTARIKGEYKGDHKMLKESVNLLGDALTSLIFQVLESVDTTAGAAVQITSVAESITVSAEEQSAQTIQVAGAIEEMSKTITENAQNAVSTYNVAKNNGEIALEGGKIVLQTVGKMKDIADVVQKSAENIENLGTSSKQIGEIISVIDEIADQTNLLALNAAIEAARAGEQGRGFAVVADEVRKLAERTTGATKQIAKMINNIQSETNNAVVFMHNGTIEVKAGIDLADKAGKSLNEIVESSQQLLNLISHIASANEQQAATGEEITKNISMISQATGESAQRIKEIAQSSEDLSRLTEQLKNEIGQFKIIDAGESQFKLNAKQRNYLSSGE